MKPCIALFMLAATLAQPRPSFEVASIKPSNSSDQRPLFTTRPELITLRNQPVKRLIEIAYGIKSFQVSGGPGWMRSDFYDIDAKPETPAKPEELLKMLQSLLADRFQLVVRRETKEMTGYALVASRNGPKFKDAHESDPNIAQVAGRPDLTQGTTRPRVMIVRRGRLTAQGTSMTMLTDQLGRILGGTVVDKTGLTGIYDLTVEWRPDEYQVSMFQEIRVPEGLGAPEPDWQGPTLFTALEEQLGLKLDSQKTPVEVLAIERVERPSAN